MGQVCDDDWLLKPFKKVVVNTHAVYSVEVSDIDQQYKQFYVTEGIKINI